MPSPVAGPPPIKAAKPLKKLMADHFYELDEAAKTRSRPVAWLTSVGPAELLLALGFLVYYPENHGAMLGATRMATELIPQANAAGYSPEICSYLTSDVGSYLAGRTPLARAYQIEAPPRPDVLVFNTNQCRDVQDWFRFYADEWSTPLIGVHTHRGLAQVKKHHVCDIVAQLKEMIPTLEEISGHRFDLDKFKERVRLSAECSRLWRAVLETATTAPAPWTFFDQTIHMAPAVVYRGRGQAIDYY
ncbi:MAG: 2-hydroxyacyl-CoA dehydratase, partial [Deltaproteobacteria bacterium]|nr:2-hydroxyacyl-CoA dehydratase [Deltaproteobacteria bacterium]